MSQELTAMKPETKQTPLSFGKQAEAFRIRVLGPMIGRDDLIVEVMAEFIESGEWSYDPQLEIITMQKGGRLEILPEGVFRGLPKTSL